MASALTFWSIALFKIGSLILALVLGLQLARKNLPFEFDITRVFNFEQFVFIYALLIVTLLAFVEGITLYQRNKESVVPVVILLIIAGLGVYFVSLPAFFGYDFDNSQTNAYIGYYLLFGAFLIFINARQVIFAKLYKE